MRFLAVMTALALVGCGVEGDPVRPTLSTTVSAGSGGVYTSVGTGARIGGVNLGVGVGL
ncbi:hypothetical protein ABIE58_001703 [Roseovarius sp. MBR-78]|jgi:hypothetical protein|uniref:argininosuccinate lyase n=1 Tax=Roseovarius sp. MBR-78 TaxID=3156460 RepID=UPI003391C286